MDKNLAVSVTIGARAGTALAAFGNIKQSLAGLGQATSLLKNKQTELGNAIQRHMGTLAPKTLATMNREYVRLGQTIDQLQSKQARLNRLQAQGETLRNTRADLRSQAMETIGTSVALAVPVVQSVRLAAGYQDAIKDVAITGDMTPKEEAKLGQTVRDAAMRFNQMQSEVAKGVGILIAEGMSPDKAKDQVGLLAKFTTATRASMEDAARMNVAFDQLGVKDKELAFNQATKGGKQGSFEVKDMARWFPELGGQLKSLGVVGNEAVVNMASRLQIARRTAGSNDEAANNFKNFLAKLTSPDTQQDFAKIGVNLQGSLINIAKQGFDPVEGAVGIIMEKMRTASPQAAAELEKLSAELSSIKDPAERAAEMERRRTMIEALGNRAGLSSMFQDMQAMSYLLAEVQNRGDLKKIREEVQTGKGKSGKSQIDEDFEKRMTGATEQFKKFKIGMVDIGITLGDALLPSINALTQEMIPVVKSFGDWVKANPDLVKGAIGLAGGLLASKLGFIGLKYALNLALTPFHAVATACTVLSSRFTIVRALLAGGVPRLPLLLQFFGMSAQRAGQLASMLGKLGSGMGWLSAKAMALGRALGSGLMRGGLMVGRTLLWLGRALLMNPIGLLITGIAIGAYLIYRHWDKIKPWFQGLWAGVKAAFAGGIGGVAKLILNWSPLGLFYKAFAGVMKWFGVSLPKNFTDFGGMLIGGLVNGIKAKIGAAKEAIVGFGQGVKGWFANTLGIKSPSRVFMGFGDNIAQGAALGISRSTAQASKAAGHMAQATLKAASQASAPASMVNRAQSGAGPMSGGGVVVHLTQTFNLEGGGKELKSQIQQATQLTVHELEKLMERVVANQRRRGYA
ncbi:hypothetical protein VI26_03265 [Chromobacterium sp. LK1]|nr:hypothetical protein VI26_03265 [Chromobacterium sp. LK1]